MLPLLPADCIYPRELGYAIRSSGPLTQVNILSNQTTALVYLEVEKGNLRGCRVPSDTAIFATLWRMVRPTGVHGHTGSH